MSIVFLLLRNSTHCFRIGQFCNIGVENNGKERTKRTKYSLNFTCSLFSCCDLKSCHTYDVTGPKHGAGKFRT